MGRRKELSDADVQQFKTRCLEIIPHVHETSLEFGSRIPGTSTRLSHAHFLDRGGIVQLNQLLYEIRRFVSISRHLSDEYYVDLLRSFIFALKDTSPSEVSIDDLCHEFLKKLESYSEEFRVILPVYGFTLEGFSLDFGGVMFSKASELELVRLYRSVADPSHLGAPSDCPELRCHEFAERLGTTWANLLVEGDPPTARRAAERKTLLALACVLVSLRSRIQLGLEKEVRFGLLDEGAQTGRASVLVNGSQFLFDDLSIVYFTPLRLSNDKLLVIRRPSQMWMDRLCQKDLSALTPVEKGLIAGIRLYYDGWHAKDNPTGIVRFMSALEAMLCPPRGGIKQSLAENLALLLEEDPANREAFATLVGGLYRKRSEILHQGMDTISDEDYRFAETIVHKVISFMGLNLVQFKNFQELEDFFRKQRICREIHPLRRIELDQEPN